MIAAAQSPLEPAAPVPVPVYAGLVTRTLAFAIDAALINIAAVLTGAVVSLAFSVLPPINGDVKAAVLATGGAAYCIWIVAYFATFWTTTGETPGNRAMHIRVSRLDGSPLDLHHAVVRLAGIVLAALPFLAGFVPILFTEQRRGLQDYLAGTVVRSGPSQH